MLVVLTSSKWTKPKATWTKGHKTQILIYSVCRAEMQCCCFWAAMWRLAMCGSLCIHLPNQCQDVVIDGHRSWKHSSWKLILLCWLLCTLMWHAASVHNSYDINSLTLTPELHCSHSHVVRRTVTQIPLPTKKPFTLLHLQKEVRCWVQKSDEISAEIMKE